MNTNAGTKWIIRIFLLAFVILVVYPLIFVLLTSIKDSTEFYTNIWGWPARVAVENYSYAWNIAKIGEYFVTTVIVVAITVVATLIISAFAGYALAKLKVPYADLIILLIFLLSMLPSESILMPTYLLVGKLKITGTYASLILPYIGWGLALSTYIYRNFFATVPTELIEAARIDGCGELRIFLQIILPIVKPATATNAIFTFMAWWGEMLWASTELSASPLKTLALGITSFVQSAGTDWGPLCAASAIILIPIIIVFLFTQKYVVSGLTGGAVKG